MNAYQVVVGETIYIIVNEWKKTRNGFQHISTLLFKPKKETESNSFWGNEKQFYEAKQIKISYINRTWERFEYQSSMRKLISEYFTNAEIVETFNKLLNLGL